MRQKTHAWQNAQQASSYALSVNETPETKRHTEIFASFSNPGDSVLDVGCGTGVLSLAYALKGCNVTSVDSSPEMLNELEKRKGSLSINMIHAHGLQIPVPDLSFDVVASRWFLSHFPQWRTFLYEKVKKCKVGGLVLFDFDLREHREFAQSRFGDEPFSDVYSNEIRSSNSDAYYDLASRDEIVAVGKQLGLELEDEFCVDFFKENMLFRAVIAPEEVKPFETELKELMKSEEVQKFIDLFERKVTMKAPAWFTRRTIFAFQKVEHRT